MLWIDFNGDIFQEFCNHFLYLKLNPNTITPIGSVIGKEKSRKGFPDSYFTSDDNKLIFAEYTTRKRLEKGQSFFNKLKSDIEDCFDTSKTGLKKIYLFINKTKNIHIKKHPIQT